MFTTYDFGYPWFLTYGLAVPIALAALLGVVGAWRGWRWLVALAVLVGGWGAAGLFVAHAVVGLNRPMALPTERFLASGSGRVLDVGAGSGRAALGVLTARPQATVTGVDIYSGFWGIEDNTPERFMANARAAGVAHRASAVTADMRDMPFDDGEFDAVVSSYAIDHLRRDGQVKALGEVARVLRPGGDFLLAIVRVDWLTWLISPILAHHPSQDPEPWRAMLQQAGFDVEEEGTGVFTLYFLARKR